MNKYLKAGFTVSQMEAVKLAAGACFSTFSGVGSTKTKLVMASYQSYSNLRRSGVRLWRCSKWWPFSPTLLHWCALISWALISSVVSLHHCVTAHCAVLPELACAKLSHHALKLHHPGLMSFFTPCLWTCSATGQKSEAEHPDDVLFWTKDYDYTKSAFKKKH